MPSTSIWFRNDTIEILKEIQNETGKSRSQILNEIVLGEQQYKAGKRKITPKEEPPEDFQLYENSLEDS